MAVLFLVVLVFGSLGYSISAYPQLRNWIISSPTLGGPSRDFNAPSGINGSITYDRGALSCGIPFPDPQGSVLAKGPDGSIIQVSVRWTFIRNCDLKTGVFQTLVTPGIYHVSFTGYPLTPPQTAAIASSNLPLTVTVEPHKLTQVNIGINYGI